MADPKQLEAELLKSIDAAKDEAAIEAVRVSALGKKGSVSELLKTLGTMTPDERKQNGPLINGLRDRVSAALTAKKDSLKAAALSAQLAADKADVTLPVRENALERGRIHPVSQVIDEVTTIFADMGFSVAEGPDIETDFYNFTALNFPEGHPAREMHDTFFFNPGADGKRKLLRTHTSGADSHDGKGEAADPRHHAGPHLSLRFRPDAYADVPSGRRARNRQGFAPWAPEMDSRGILQGVLRSAIGEDALPPVVLSVHRAVDGSRYPVRPARQRNPLRRGQ